MSGVRVFLQASTIKVRTVNYGLPLFSITATNFDQCEQLRSKIEAAARDWRQALQKPALGARASSSQKTCRPVRGV